MYIRGQKQEVLFWEHFPNGDGFRFVASEYLQTDLQKSPETWCLNHSTEIEILPYPLKTLCEIGSLRENIFLTGFMLQEV